MIFFTQFLYTDIIKVNTFNNYHEFYFKLFGQKEMLNVIVLKYVYLRKIIINFMMSVASKISNVTYSIRRKKETTEFLGRKNYRQNGNFFFFLLKTRVFVKRN